MVHSGRFHHPLAKFALSGANLAVEQVFVPESFLFLREYFSCLEKNIQLECSSGRIEST